MLFEMLDRIATVRVLLVLMLLSVLFPTVLFPATGLVESRPLDLYSSYRPDQVYEYLGELGARGRIAYARFELTMDLLFPLLYSLALTVALVMAARKLLPPESRLQYLRFIPLLIVIADWCENLSLAVVIYTFPDRLDSLAAAASLFTTLKWVFLAMSVMLLIMAAGLGLRACLCKT